MRGLWKYLVLLAGIAGIVGFFLPFVTVHTRDARFGRHPSAFELVRRLEGLDDMTHSLTALGIATPDAKQMASQAHDTLQTARTAASVIYAPAALLALLAPDRGSVALPVKTRRSREQRKNTAVIPIRSAMQERKAHRCAARAWCHA
jgi:hypothetical protein